MVDLKPWPANKKDSAIKQIFKELEGKSNPNRFYFNVFLKSGESYEKVGSVADLTRNGRYLGTERSRLVMPPSEHMLGLFCTFQNLFFPTLKRCIPGFIQAFTTEALEEVFNQAIEAGLT